MSAGLDTKKIAQRVTESYLTQVLTHGFLHSDPHPGNVAVDSEGGLVRSAALAMLICPSPGDAAGEKAWYSWPYLHCCAAGVL